ncbi:MAG: RluA family pseudouridine synthase [Planctomycetes bacterium]|nr:RluA family pseudouridine synthase [Planctomycetota bacterium]
MLLRSTSPTPLLPFLAEQLPGWKKNTLRERLALGCVRVNGEVITRANHQLAAGDVVEVLAAGEAPAPARAPHGIVVLHEDDELVAIDKPSGLLAVSTDREQERTALALLRRHLSRPGREATLWPVHRLDRETSGVLLFARTRAACDAVQARWDEARKTYLAVVEGRPKADAGSIEVPLWEDKDLRVHAGERAGARPALTRYRSLATGPARTLLEVELATGRRHQIRVHLAWLGHPVVGDERYGRRDARLGLHAWRLAVIRPGADGPLEVEAGEPPGLRELLRSR